MVFVNIKKLKEKAQIPTRGSEYAAGYDLYACLDKESIEIAPHTTAKIGTGLSIAVPNGYFGAIFARSGLAAKSGLRPANCVGVADSDYRGEYIVALHNDSDEVRTVCDGDRIAQLIIMPVVMAEYIEAEELSDTQRGGGGFIRIKKISVDKSNYLMHVVGAIGDSIGYSSASAILSNMEIEEIITSRERKIILAAISDRVIPFSGPVRDSYRARVFKNILISMI